MRLNITSSDFTPAEEAVAKPQKTRSHAPRGNVCVTIFKGYSGSVYTRSHGKTGFATASEASVETLRRVVMAVLVVIFAYQGYQFTHQIWQQWAKPPTPLAFDVQTRAKSLADEQRILSGQGYEHALPYNLFGQYVPPAPKIEDLPVTELNIQLLAIMRSSNKAGSAVMINYEGQTGLYYQGDKLPNGVFIKEIVGNQITLSGNNKVERLLMDNLQGEQYAGMFNADQPLTLSSHAAGDLAKQPPVYDPGDQSDELRGELEALRDLLNAS